MANKRIYFASPTGAALTLSLQEKTAAMPSHGMYRAEIDLKQFIAERSVPALLFAFLSKMKRVEHTFVVVHSGPRVELGKTLVVIGENKKSTIYGVSSEISRDVLGVLTSLPYGEIFVLGLTNATDISSQLPSLTDLDGAMTALGGNSLWAICYDNESAVVTLLAREREVVKEQVMDALERDLGSL